MGFNYYQTIHLIITKGHQITDQVSRELKEFGISEPQYNVMRILFEANNIPVTAQHIQERMVQKGSNVTRILDKLERKELVLRQACESNRRKVDIKLSRKGNFFLKKLDRKVHSMHSPFMDMLNENELEHLHGLLKRLDYSNLDNTQNLIHEEESLGIWSQ